MDRVTHCVPLVDDVPVDPDCFTSRQMAGELLPAR